MSFQLADMQGNLTSWSLGDNKPNSSPVHIQSLYIDKEELDYVRFKFRNIPITSTGPCTWAGEMARFIFDNL